MRLSYYISKHLALTLISLALSLCIFIGCIYCYMVFKLPNVDKLEEIKLQMPLRIYTQDKQLIAEYGAMRRNPVSLNQVPKPLIDAMIATEDQRYFEHYGVDLIGILRAVKELIITGQKTQGGSTISMQVARNFFLTPEKTFIRKINEMLLAVKIDSNFSKEKILELYINRIYLGQHAYGVSSAAAIYYGKSLDELNLAEMAMIAGLPQSPSKVNPINNPVAAEIRRNHVLARMLELGYIDQNAYQKAIATPTATYYHGPKITVIAPQIAEMVRHVIYQQYGDAGYTAGLQVYTTLDSHLQQTANNALRDGLVAYERRLKNYRGPEKNLGPLPADLSNWQNTLSDLPNLTVDGFIPAAITHITAEKVTVLLANGLKMTLPAVELMWPRRFRSVLKVGDIIRLLDENGKWQLAQIPQVQGALVSLNVGNGAILALNGGLDDTDTGFNRVIQANRQPGSNFKPFIYAAALAKGYTLATLIDDSPLAINDTGDPNNLWQPQNDDGMFHGPTRLRLGLVRSINLVSIRLLQLMGIDDTLHYLAQFGFDTQKLPASLSLALGTASLAPIQIATGYTVFANGGYLVTPYFIQQIQSAEGKILYQANPPTAPGYVKPSIMSPPAPRVIEADVAYLITNALQDVIKEGTGYAAHVLNREDIAGKTGTTNRQVDAWFSGFNTQIATTTWVGYDQPKSLNEYGGQAALPIWIDFMRIALAKTPIIMFPIPPNITRMLIDPQTGQPAQPNQDNAIEEFFRSDTLASEQTNPNQSEKTIVDENQKLLDPMDTHSNEKTEEVQLF